jgi:hypothetical protein
MSTQTEAQRIKFATPDAGTTIEFRKALALISDRDIEWQNITGFQQHTLEKMQADYDARIEELEAEVQALRGAVPAVVDDWQARIDAIIQAVADQDDLAAQSMLSEARRILEAAPQPAAQQTVVWPKSKDVGRYGDMSPSAHMRVGLDSDNDAYVSVWDEHGGGCVEFCNGGSGGGSSMKTRLALIDLMVAMEEDNAARPDKDWLARRAAASKQGEK